MAPPGRRRRRRRTLQCAAARLLGGNLLLACCSAARMAGSQQPAFLSSHHVLTSSRLCVPWKGLYGEQQRAGGQGSILPHHLHQPTPVPSSPAQEGDDAFMRLALELAREAFQSGEIPVGAVLVDDQGTILSSARNRVESTGDASAHAELECLRQAARDMRSSSWRMTDTTLYVTLEPCLMCLGSIQSFRVRRVVYGARNHLLGAVESFIRVLDYKHPFHVVEVTGGVLADECGGLMRDFFVARRKGLLAPKRDGGGGGGGGGSSSSHQGEGDGGGVADGALSSELPDLL